MSGSGGCDHGIKWKKIFMGNFIFRLKTYKGPFTYYVSNHRGGGRVFANDCISNTTNL